MGSYGPAARMDQGQGWGTQMDGNQEDSWKYF